MSPAGRRAALPSPGWLQAHRQQQRSTLTLYPENSPPGGLVIDLDTWPGPTSMRRQFGAALERLVGTAGTVRRAQTVGVYVTHCRTFLAWIEAWDDPNLPANAERPEVFEALTPGVWTAWIMQCQRRGKNAGVRLLLNIARLIGETPDLPADIVRTVSRRKPSIPDRQEPSHYSVTEIASLRRAARRTVRQAHARISTNYALALRHDEPLGDLRELAKAATLHEILMVGLPTSTQGFDAVDARKRLTYTSATRGAGQVTHKRQKGIARSLLFPTGAEALACAVALVCARGYNLTPLLEVDVPDRNMDTAGRLAQLNLDKARRGSRQRFFPDIVETDGGNSDGAILRLIEELTEPLREHSAALGHEVTNLIVHMNEAGRVVSGTLQVNRATAAWLPEGLALDFRKLKRSVEVRELREPLGNTDQTHIDVYQRGDPDFIAEQQDRAREGISRALRLALQLTRLTFLDHDDAAGPEIASGRHDTALASCLDVLHHPDTGETCYDSFLLCLRCSNAVATPRHLPRLLTALDALEDLRGGYPADLWLLQFEGHYAGLRALVEHRTTEVERQAARARITDGDRVLIGDLLRGR